MVEGYPIDNRGRRGWPHDGLRRDPCPLRAGLVHQAADTTAASGGFPRVLMRRDLRW